jgi:hypothetical protein
MLYFFSLRSFAALRDFEIMVHAIRQLTEEYAE